MEIVFWTVGALALFALALALLGFATLVAVLVVAAVRDLRAAR